MKMTKYTRQYIHEFCLEKEDKKKLLDVFRKREITKTTKCDKILKINKYERPLNVFSTDYKSELEEVKNLPLGVVDFWDILSSNCQRLINDFYYLKYKSDHKFKYTYLFDNEHSGENGYIERRLLRIKEFAKFHDLNVFDEYDELDIDYLSDVFYSNRIIDDAKVRLQIIVYAIKESDFSLIDLDKEDNVILTSLAFERFIKDKEIIPLTTEEKIRKSVVNTKNNFKNLCFANADKFEYFITLTFACKDEKEKHLELNKYRKENEQELLFKYVQDATNYECCVKSMTYFLNKMKKYLQRKGNEFYYLGVPEYQKNGNIHYHFLMSKIPDEYLFDNPDWADRDYNTNKKLFSKGLSIWDYGLSNVSFIKDKAKCCTYISKYMTKSLSEIDSTIYFDRLNKKRFYRSNNLNVPDVSYGYFDEDSLEYVSFYETFGTNLFDGSIISIRQYQLEEL